MQNGFIIDWETLAALLANTSDDSQAAFFRVFTKEMTTCCKTHFNAEMQMMAIRSKLTQSEREFLSTLSYEPDKP